MRIFSSRLRPRHALLLASALASIVPFGADMPRGPAAQTATIVAEWDKQAVSQLIDAIEASRVEGLNPTDYRLDALRRTAAAGEGAALDVLANEAALQLAHDYYFGRVGDRSEMQWMIERSPYEVQQLPDRLRDAVAHGKIGEFFASLLPSDPRYQALRDALDNADDKGDRDRLRVNMERWRWMPRSLAPSYLYINVPSYRLQVIRDGAQLSSYDIVVGAPDTPTPQLVSPTGSLVVNPAWNVPPSIVKSSHLRPGRGGYVRKANGDGTYRVVQPPGPRNALGKIKFNLENDQSIYMHDTNAKAIFRRDMRALSHGCIRVKDIDQLASELMMDGGDGAGLEEALASSHTATVRLPQTWPVYIVYFTAEADPAGGIATYDDPYGYDARVLAALDGKPVEVASNETRFQLR